MILLRADGCIDGVVGLGLGGGRGPCGFGLGSEGC